MKIEKRPVVSDIKLLKEGVFYRVADLEAILKNIGINFSIFTIRDAETWKCLDYHCGKRHNRRVTKCERCGGKVRSPLIKSPRTLGGGTGVGHRRYTKQEIEEIVEIFKKRS